MKLQVNIQNCYGIGKFDKEFDFSNENMFLKACHDFKL